MLSHQVYAQVPQCTAVYSLYVQTSCTVRTDYGCVVQPRQPGSCSSWGCSEAASAQIAPGENFSLGKCVIGHSVSHVGDGLRLSTIGWLQRTQWKQWLTAFFVFVFCICKVQSLCVAQRACACLYTPAHVRGADAQPGL